MVESAKQGVRIPVNGFAVPWKEGALLFKEVAAGPSYGLAPGRNLPGKGRLDGIEILKKPGWLVVELFALFPMSPPSWDRRRSPIAVMNHTAQRIEKPKIDGESASARPWITTRSKRGLLASSGMFGTLAPMWAKLRLVAAGIDMRVARLNALSAYRDAEAGLLAKETACAREAKPQASTSHMPHPPRTMKFRNATKQSPSLLDC